MNLYIDIEVIPNLSADQVSEMALSIKPPGNIKKPDNIEKWMTENGESKLDELTRKACFHELTGRIVCIGYAIDNEPANILIGDEATILEQFYNIWLNPKDNRPPTLIGHNSIAFDIPYIWRRAKALGVKVPASYPSPAELKPWSVATDDTMIMWSGVRDRISLDNLANGLGLKSHKDQLDGSKVWDFWKAGRKEEIYEYCKDDVNLTREVYKRLL